MTLFSVHQSIGGIFFKDDFETSECFRAELAIQDSLRLDIAIAIIFTQSNRITKVDR